MPQTRAQKRAAAKISNESSGTGAEPAAAPVSDAKRSKVDEGVEETKGSEAPAPVSPPKVEKSVKDIEANTVVCIPPNVELLSDDDFVALGDILSTHKCLKRFTLNAKEIGIVGAKALWKGLSLNTSLEEVVLEHCKFRDEATMEWLSVNTSIKKLRFYDCHNVNVVALGAALVVNKTLTELILEETQVDLGGAQALARVLDANTCLLTLGFYSSLGVDGLRALARALEVNNTLSTLRLDDNRFGVDGARVLARVLEVNTSLSRLTLGYSYIGDDSATALARALEINSTLTDLNLGMNDIEDAGGLALTACLKVNVGLKTLRMGFNKISKKVQRKLKEAAKEAKVELEVW